PARYERRVHGAIPHVHDEGLARQIHVDPALARADLRRRWGELRFDHVVSDDPLVLVDAEVALLLVLADLLDPDHRVARERRALFASSRRRIHGRAVAPHPSERSRKRYTAELDPGRRVEI